MSEHDVAWLTEAIAETFNQVGNSCMMPALQSSPEHHPKGLSPNGLPPPKVAWTADPTPAPPPAATCAGTAEGACASAHVTSRSRNEYKQWVEQWRLLLKREQLAANGACYLCVFCVCHMPHTFAARELKCSMFMKLASPVGISSYFCARCPMALCRCASGGM
eukprot:scaffold134809_cov19-Tisochrysis_lutea.AAC.1